MTEKHQRHPRREEHSSVPEAKGKNNLFADVFHKINVASLLYAPRNGKIVDVNNAFISFSGFSASELIDRPLFSLKDFDKLQDDPKITRKLQENLKISNIHISFITKKEKKKILTFSTTPLEYGDEEITLITFHDITTEVNAIAFQDLLYTRYRNIINNITTCVIIYKVTGNSDRFIVTDINKAVEELENIRKEDVIGREIRDVFPMVKDHEILEVFSSVYRTGKYTFLSTSFKKKEGKRRWTDNFIFKLSNDELLVTYQDRTSEKLYQREIKESEKRYRDLANLLPVVVFETDISGKIIYANKMAMKMFRYSKKDLESGLRVETMLIPEERLKARREIFYQIRGGSSEKAIEFTGLRKDGTTFPVNFLVSPIIKDGEFKGFRGILNDLTEQKNIQEQLRRDKTYLESLIQGAPEAIMQSFKDGTIIRINKEFTRLFGYTQEEVQGLYVGDILYGDDEKVRQEGLKLIEKIAKGKAQNSDTVRYRKDGTPVPVSFLGSPIILDGKIIGVYGIYRNISDRKKNEKITETILNISTSALATQTQHEFFDVIRHELSSIINTRNLFIALYNKEKETLHFPLHMDEKDDIETFREVSARQTLSGYVIRQGKPVLLREKEIIQLEKQGEFTRLGTPSKVWLGVPLKVDDEIIGIISIQDYKDEQAFSINDLKILRIISNQIALAIKHKQAQELLRVAKEKAEENARFKEQFLSTMSHEIRTPLNAIIGMTRLLSNTNPSPGQINYIKALEMSGNNLLRLINDILDYSKLEAGKMVIEEIEFNPREQVETLSSSYHFIAEEKGLKFITKIDKNIPPLVAGDPTRINQILTNLIGNAIKFTEKGAVILSLGFLEETEEEVTLEYSVEDTGIGIPKDKLESIFESFTQADKATTRKFGGTGLGLSISKKIADLLNTSIIVESEPGKGTRFSFTLTLKKVFKTGKEFIPDDMEKIIPALKGKRVLIAEDNALNRIVAMKSMKEWEMVIRQCENGKEALEKVKKQDFDVILMDLQMPVMDGYEATRAIRNLPDKKKKKIPVIALTASALMDIRSQAKEYEMDDILIKPFRPEDLARMLYHQIMKREKSDK